MPYREIALPKALLFLEPGPLTLITTFDGQKNNVMTISWIMPIDFDGGAVMATRDILLAEFDGLAVLVNHHPSKIGGKADRREAAMRRMLETADSLLSAGHERILAIGDFNDELWPPDGAGTLKYNGRWEKIDGFFSFGDFEIREEVFVHPLLLTEDKAFGGMKPRRCFVGPRYEGGVSDHLPIILEILL